MIIKVTILNNDFMYILKGEVLTMSEFAVHESLKGCSSIHKPKRHAKPLKIAKRDAKGSLRDIGFLRRGLPESRKYVEGSKAVLKYKHASTPLPALNPGLSGVS